MTEFRYESVEFQGQKYILTFGDVTSRKKTLVGVTDVKDDIHYESGEIAAADEKLMPTATIASGYGMPDSIEREVPIRIFDEIASYIQEGRTDELSESLSKLGEEVLGKEKNELSSSEQAERMMRMRDFEASPTDYL